MITHSELARSWGVCTVRALAKESKQNQDGKAEVLGEASKGN